MAGKSVTNRNQENGHIRYYQIGGVTIQVKSDLLITDTTFGPAFKCFEVNGPEKDTIFIRHHFGLPTLPHSYPGDVVYQRPPWVIYRQEDAWVYFCFPGQGLGTNGKDLGKMRHHSNLMAVFNRDYTRGHIYSKTEALFRKGGVQSLTLFPTDQILISQALANRAGCYMHAAGVIYDGKGLLFAGHSDAGKSTMVTLLKDRARTLCDDRMIVRKWEDGFRIHGTWSHGDVPTVSADSERLKAIFFLEKSEENRLLPVERRKEKMKRLLACLIKPLTTALWWEKMFALVENMADEIPCYTLHFDKSGRVRGLLDRV